METARKNFDALKKARKQSAQTGAREKIFVVAFQQMPGNDEPIVKIRQHFHVRDGEERALPNHARHFSEKGFRIFHMLQNLDANCAIEFVIHARKFFRFRIDLAKRQSPSLKHFEATAVHFET